MTQMTQDDAEPAVCVMAFVAGQGLFFGWHDADDAASSLLGQKRGCLLWCGAASSVKKEPLRGATMQGGAAAEQQEEHASAGVLLLLVRTIVRGAGQNIRFSACGGGACRRVISR